MSFVRRFSQSYFVSKNRCEWASEQLQKHSVYNTSTAYKFITFCVHHWEMEEPDFHYLKRGISSFELVHFLLRVSFRHHYYWARWCTLCIAGICSWAEVTINLLIHTEIKKTGGDWQMVWNKNSQSVHGFQSFIVLSLLNVTSKLRWGWCVTPIISLSWACRVTKYNSLGSIRTTNRNCTAQWHCKCCTSCDVKAQLHTLTRLVVSKTVFTGLREKPRENLPSSSVQACLIDD